MSFRMEEEVMKKFTLVVLSLFLSLSIATFPASSADTPDEQFVPGSISTQGMSGDRYGVFFEESVDTLRMPSLLYGYNFSNNRMCGVDFCSSIEDPACSSAATLKYYALFPPCTTDSDVDCIESVYAIPDGAPAKVQGKFIRQMPAQVSHPYKGSLKDGLPQGGNAGLWNIPGVKHKGGGEDYAVIVSLVGDINRSNPSQSVVGDLRAVILPETLVSMMFSMD